MLLCLIGISPDFKDPHIHRVSMSSQECRSHRKYCPSTSLQCLPWPGGSSNSSLLTGKLTPKQVEWSSWRITVRKQQSFLFLIFFSFLTLQYCVGFAIHQHESAMGIPCSPELPVWLNPNAGREITHRWSGRHHFSAMLFIWYPWYKTAE